jgi:hypothetical protein
MKSSVASQSIEVKSSRLDTGPTEYSERSFAWAMADLNQWCPVANCCYRFRSRHRMKDVLGSLWHSTFFGSMLVKRVPLNHSIERMPSRLRRLVPAHVKR